MASITTKRAATGLWALTALLSVAVALFSYRYLTLSSLRAPDILANAYARPWLSVHVAASATALLLGPSSAQQILLRMTYNLKGSYLRLRQLPEALRQIDRVLVLAPERYEEHRDRGLLLGEAGRREPALESLRLYLEQAPEADDRDIILEVVKELES